MIDAKLFSSCCSMSFETRSKGPNCLNFHQSLVDGGLGSTVAESNFRSNWALQLAWSNGSQCLAVVCPIRPSN